MSNEIRGTVTCEIDGERLDLLLSTNEWCNLEDELGKTTDEILKMFFDMVSAQKLEMRLLRTLFRAALSSAKPGITTVEAGLLMTKMGLVEASAQLAKTIVASLPKVEAAEDGANTGVGKPKAPTGRKSRR